MADFKRHLMFSTTLGVAYGATAATCFEAPLSTSILAGGLCSLSGMLPDVDSNSGKPLRESLAFAAAIVPMMMVERFARLGMSPETMVMAGAGVYLFVRFVFGYWFKHYTVHRGMFHSLPAAVIMGELAFLLTSGDDLGLRIFKAAAVTLGYMSHLLLDEIYSVEWRRGFLRVKRSFGTAIKMYSPNHWGANISAYAKLALITYVVVCEPGWMEKYDDLDAAVGQVAEQVVQRAEETTAGRGFLPLR